MISIETLYFLYWDFLRENAYKLGFDDQFIRNVNSLKKIAKQISTSLDMKSRDDFYAEGINSFIEIFNDLEIDIVKGIRTKEEFLVVINKMRQKQKKIYSAIEMQIIEKIKLKH